MPTALDLGECKHGLRLTYCDLCAYRVASATAHGDLVVTRLRQRSPARLTPQEQERRVQALAADVRRDKRRRLAVDLERGLFPRTDRVRTNPSEFWHPDYQGLECPKHERVNADNLAVALAWDKKRKRAHRR